MRINKFTCLLLGMMMLELSSCRLFRSVSKHTDRTLDKVESILDEPVQKKDLYSMDTITVKDDIWLGSKSLRVNAGDPLPARFETDEGITLVSNTPVSLMQISEQISALTGITVRVDDMILEEVKGASQGASEGSASASTNSDTSLFMPSYSGKLSGLLDQIVSRFALWWRYKNGVITFYKMETRVFTIYALPVQTQLSANIAGTASGEDGGTTSASMSSAITLDVWQQLEAAISAMLPNGATMNVIPANGTVTVTAPPSTLQRVSQYVNAMNEKLSRQVAISVKVLNVVLNDTENTGLDVTGVLKYIKKRTQTAKTIVDKTIDTSFGGSSMSVLLTGGDGHLNSGSLIMSALSTQGATSLVTSATVLTMNNKIAPVQVSTNRSYIEKSESSKDENGTSFAVSPGKINYGFTMEVLPRLLDHGRMLLMFTMTLTDLEEMQEKTFGTEENGMVMQLPRMKTRGFVQEIAMTSGQTLMLSGFEEVRTQMAETKELSSVSANTTKDRTVMVVLLTPEVLISPLSPETRMQDF